jgi:Na+(H+)/acetate symporter ActP
MAAPQIFRSSETAFGPGVPSAAFALPVFFLAAFLAGAFAVAFAFAVGLALVVVPALIANCPRSIFWNRASAPLSLISRRMAACYSR